jgi:hypothetical protein
MSWSQLVAIGLILLALTVFTPLRIVVFSAMGVAIAMWAGFLASIALLIFLIVAGILLGVDRVQAQRRAASELEAEKEKIDEPDYRRAA